MDQAIKKQVLKTFTYGMFIITAKSGEKISASSVTWVTQSSFTPPLIAVGLRTDSGPYHVIRDSGFFALHIVPAGEKPLASGFFRQAQVKDYQINGHKFDTHPEYDVPILDELPAYLVGEVKEISEIGDHHLVIAEVVDAQLRQNFSPMVLRDTGWSYSG